MPIHVAWVVHGGGPAVTGHGGRGEARAVCPGRVPGGDGSPAVPRAKLQELTTTALIKQGTELDPGWTLAGMMA
jgi:hypothetical protein